MRRTPLILNLFFLLASLVAAADGWSGAPIGVPPGHAMVAGRQHGGASPWAVLGILPSDDDERSLPTCSPAGASAAAALLSPVVPTPCLLWRRATAPVDQPSSHLFLSAASPRGPPQVS
ncbi:hypothetical protein [Methylobacterium nodulans]|uniref:hypothetical protein n=1 Tax=Methylobacterium nodulans TaxID=114616 RepID=UPI0005C17E37|nr:hypothetical protein [Methylobacterium nodulans]